MATDNPAMRATEDTLFARRVKIAYTNDTERNIVRNNSDVTNSRTIGSHMAL